MRLTPAERRNIEAKLAEAMADPENIAAGSTLNIQVAVEKARLSDGTVLTVPKDARPFPDRWGQMRGPRGKVAWHRWRHVESTSGGTYGWWPVCMPHVHQSVGPYYDVTSPPAGESVCRTCKKIGLGVAKWELSPQAVDWMFKGGA